MDWKILIVVVLALIVFFGVQKCSESDTPDYDRIQAAERAERQTELEKKIVRLLTKAIAELEDMIRTGIEVLTDMGVDRQSVMDILSMVNRADVLVDNRKHREAWDLMTGAQTLLEDLKQAAYIDIKEKRLEDIGRLLNVADELQICFSAPRNGASISKTIPS